MRTKTKCLIAAMSLMGALFVVSGCEEIEPVSQDPVSEPEPALTTRAIGGGATIQLSQGVVLSAAAADYFTTVAESLPGSAFSSEPKWFSIPTPPSEYSFVGWTVPPGATLTGGITNRSVNFTFNSPGSYDVKAKFNIVGLGVIIELTKTVAVNARPTITGPSFVDVNTNVAFSVTQPTVGSFTNWTVEPNSNYTVSGGTTSTTLNIRFTETGVFFLDANFQLPDNTTYFVSESIFVSAPDLSNHTPILTGQWSSTPPSIISYTITNSFPGPTYEWEINGQSNGTSAYSNNILVFDTGRIVNREMMYNVPPPPYTPPSPPAWGATITTRCRAIVRNSSGVIIEASNWSAPRQDTFPAFY